MKKAISIAIVIITVVGWIFSATPLGGAGIGERMKLGLDMIGGVSVVLEADTDATGAELKAVMDQVQAVMERRINEMGLSEPVIAIENEDRIRIELPGAQNAGEAIESIGRTAKLSFITADGAVILDGEHVKNAVAAVYNGYDSALIGTYAVNLEFDSAGTDAFAKATSDIVSGKIRSATSLSPSQIAILLDEDVISAPFVSTVINSSSCQITGNFDADSASNLAALIRGGSLPVGLTEVQTEIVGPSLGMNAAQKCVIAGLLGTALIFILMIGRYRLMGVAADIALALYILIVLWVYILFRAVLTLPGIAGLILSVGMAVDSNVIIFSRIMEDIRQGKTVRVAVHSGFKRAMTTIIDSQLTTVIAAVILYEFGTGAVRGFALTLMIGIAASLLTAVVVTQQLLKALCETRLATPKAFAVDKVVPVLTEEQSREAVKNYGFDFLGKRRLFYNAAAALIVLGIGLGLARGFNLGIDFTGGTMLQLDMGRPSDSSQVSSYLSSELGVQADVQLAGETGDKVIIKTTQVIDSAMRSRICAGLSERFGLGMSEEAMVQQAGLIGPSVGSQLRSAALKACLIAAVAMLVYIAVRFEIRFGIAALTALLHDVAMLFALYGITHIQMNSPFIAGLLIVLGYSINDTIVVFDRVRENLKSLRNTRLETVVDLSVNQSVERSFMTSLTTAISIIPLIVLGGETIRAFAIPLIGGVVFGTFSSLCIAPAIYYDITKLTRKNRYRGA
jgi:SecD/SecF fusion protein